MSKLYFLDSFDHYTTADFAKKWTGSDYLSNVIIASGRTGNGAASNYAPNPIALEKGIDYIPRVTAGMAFKVSSLANTKDTITISNWPKNNSGGNVHAQVQLRPEGAFQVAVYNGSLTLGGTVWYSALSSSVIKVNTWYYLEVQMHHYKGGSPLSDFLAIEVRVNNLTVLTTTMSLWDCTLTGLNWCRFGGTNMVIDDVYITDDVFLGDISIGVIRPAADTAMADWVPLGSGDHFSEVDDVNPDDDASYVSSAVVGDADLYDMTTLGWSGVVKGIQTNMVANKDDAGPAVIKARYEIDGDPYLGEELAPSLGTWSDMRDTKLVNPATGVAFTMGEIDALVAGVERTA